MIQDMCPNGVEWKTFAELGTFYGGLSGKNKDDFKDGNAKYITYLNIGNNPSLRFDILETVKISPNEKQNTIQYGDALFTGSSETPDECAMSSVVTEQPKEDIYLNSFCFGFRFNRLDGICPAFYKHYFRCDAFRKSVRRTANGTTRFNVSKKDFAKLDIPIPPLEIQKKIVECLDTFSALAAELQAELQLRRKQYEYFRTRLLTPHSESDSTDNTDDCNWDFKPLSEICDLVKDRISASKLNADTYVSVENLLANKQGKIPSISVPTFGNVINYHKDNVLIGNIRPYLRKIWLADSEGGTNGDVITLGIKNKYQNKINPRFLYHALADERFFIYDIQYSSGAKMPRGSKDKVMEYQIAIPSLKKQAELVELLDKFEKLTTSLSDGIPAEQAAQQKRYEYYRDLLLTFPRKAV